MNRPSDIEKLSSDKRLAWRALSTLGTQLPLMDPALSVEEAPSAADMSTATVTVSIPNDHTLANGPMVALGMLSADLLHSYCDEEGCICMEYILNLIVSIKGDIKLMVFSAFENTDSTSNHFSFSRLR